MTDTLLLIVNIGLCLGGFITMTMAPVVLAILSDNDWL